MTIRLGIIGTGNIGSHHVGVFSAMPGVQVTACCDLVRERAEQQAARVGATVVETLDEVIALSDAVVVSTPDNCHAPMSLQVLAAGKHLLCEKPLTCSLAEARAVASAARAASAHGVLHMIDFSYRRSSAMQEAIRLARTGALGEIRQVQSSYLQSWLSCHPAWNNTDDWTASYLLWKLSTAAGSRGVLGDLGCHLLDLTTACSEEISAVRCELRSYPKPTADGAMVTEYQGNALDANDAAFIELQFVNGGIGIAHTSRWATGYTNAIRLEVHGTEGAIRLDLDQSYEALELCVGDARHRQQWDRHYLPTTPTVQERFITALRTGTPAEPDLLRGAYIQACLEACFTSGHTHAWETIPSLD